MHITYVFLAMLPLALASPLRLYALPENAVSEEDCVYPASYNITNFTYYQLNNDSMGNHLDFVFVDPDTKIDTYCTLNSSSPNSVASNPSLAPRYTCNNSIVSFIVSGMKLTIIEKACPDAGGEFEASRGMSITWNNCYADGGFTVCTTDPMTNRFSSLQPVPH